MNTKLEEIYKSLIPNPDDVILIKTLFSHPGWIKYEECINRDIESLSGWIDKLTDGVTPLNAENLELLKQITILRRSLKLKILYKEELLDSIKNPSELEEQKEAENFTVPE